MDIFLRILGVLIFVAFILTLAELFRRVYRRFSGILDKIKRRL
jgi:hypothetical protein